MNPSINAHHRLVLLLLVPIVESLFPCKCVHFNQSRGVFHSPNFPQKLRETECLFFHFQAPPDHFVHLSFQQFHLPPRIDRCSSSVAVFDHSIDGTIEMGEEADFEKCGKEMSGDEFYSKFEHMLLKIETVEVSNGFHGTYEMVPRSKFLTKALQLADCSYRIESNNAVIYSPLYPYYYPPNLNCTYQIPHRKGHQIIINSISLQIGRESQLRVFETIKQRYDERRLIDVVSSGQKSLYLVSSSSLLLYFASGSENTQKASGFVIELKYSSSGFSSTAGDVLSTTTDCQLSINSDNFKSGSVNSDKLDRLAAASLVPSKCRVVFQGFANEKISIKFRRFQLYVPENKNTSKCGDVDNLSADVRVGSRLSRINEWCGNEMPPNLMSSSNLLQVEYNTKSSKTIRDSSNEDIGFELEYKFHTDWNMESMRARVDKNKECRFAFNSSEHASGKLWSANYPGLYPRNLYCEYIFHGRHDQVVHIHFEYFDVEGFNQCDETTQSDFILFSNYQTHDRTNRRFCGKTPPKGPILSESNYFRMIFSTNDIFDATGFFAHYQFITQEKPQISRVKLTTAAASHPSLILLLLIILVSS